MLNILLLKQNGGIKTVTFDEGDTNKDIDFSSYAKHNVNFIHKWSLDKLVNIDSPLSLSLYAQTNFNDKLNINKHDLPPPLHNLENVYYGNIIIIGVDKEDNIVNFEKKHWTSLIEILNCEDDEDEDEDDEDEEDDEDDEDDDDEDFIVNDLEEEDDDDEGVDEEDDNTSISTYIDNIEYEQIIGKQTVEIYRLKHKIKQLENKIIS